MNGKTSATINGTATLARIGETTQNVPISIELMRGTTLTLWVGHFIGFINPINGTIIKGQ